MTDSVNQTRLLAILKTLAQGHYNQSKLLGELPNLTTTQKTTLVAAINEIQASVANLSGSLKADQVNQLIESKINELIAGAPAALNTLKEIADKLAQDETAVSAVLQKVAALQQKQDELSGNTVVIPDSWNADIVRIMTTGA